MRRLGTGLAKLLAAAALVGCVAPGAMAQAPAAQPAAKTWPSVEGDYVARDFRFHDGQVLPQVRIHYTTLGRPHRNAKGEVDNAVMVLHGTGGDGHQFFRPSFADNLYGPGQPLDIGRYYIILPDDIGHGKSSKPSDGLHMRFPHYDYADMVDLEHRLAADGLGVRKLRLVMGTSMGCMHAFVWGEQYPDAMAALMPLACAPVRLAGRNRIWRAALVDGIEADPAWQGGEYKAEPKQGLRTASDFLLIAGSAPIQWQHLYPTPEAGEAYLKTYTEHELATLDANDLIYQVQASRDYDPEPNIEKIRVPVLWINSADDFINPPDLHFEQTILPRNRLISFVDVPASLHTFGHGTHTHGEVWGDRLAGLLKASATPDMP